MRKSILLLAFTLICFMSFAQNKEDAEKMVDEGVAWHDKGDYDAAIEKYNQALALDADNLLALSEKGLTLVALQRFDEAIKCSKTALEKHPGEKGLKLVYVNYGNPLDGLGKSSNSLEIYEAGIKAFPDFYELYFNKGVTLASLQKYDEALLSFHKAVALNPNHASSHNGIGRLSTAQNKKIPALLAYARFLVIEPGSERSKQNLAGIQKILHGNATQTGEKNVTINIDPAMLETSKKGKNKENNFSSTEFLMAMSAGLDFNDENKNKTAVEKFIDKFKLVCSSLSETQKDNRGFYWSYYVPYFASMNDNKMVETFGYIAFASSGDEAVTDWLKNHKEDTDKFYDWSEAFTWKSN